MRHRNSRGGHILPALMLFLGGCAAAATTADVGGERRQLLPVDRADEDRRFATYRADLLRAVEARDLAALEKLLDPKIRTDFGGGGGLADFRRHWNLPSSDSLLWSELETILRLGGSFRELPGTKQFCAPYVYSDWPDDLDAFEHVAVIARNVPLKDAPSDSARTVATLAYDLVRLLSFEDADSEWRHVELEDGTRGWVRRAHVRSPIGYRACFAESDGAWRMTLLVAGD